MLDLEFGLGEMTWAVFPRYDNAGSRLGHGHAPTNREISKLHYQYTNTGDIVVDLFGGTFATSKACLQSGRPRVFVGCEIDINCTKTASNELVRCFVTAVVRDEYPIPGTDEEKKWCKIVRKSLTSAPFSARSVRTWNTPSRLDPLQIFRD